MAITREQVLQVASLARLRVSESDAERLTQELGKILGYVEKLNELDTSGVEPTLQVTVERAPLRPDVVSPGLSKAAALGAAPRADGTGFLVPGFVDES